MPWIKMRTELWEDGRLRKLARELGVPRAHVLGALARLWSVADQHATEEGIMPGYQPEDIDEDVEIPGFCRSLPTDWLEIREDALVLPEYTEHNGSTAKTRALTAKRNARKRKRDADVTVDASRGRHLDERRGEKKREEKKKNPPKSPLRGEGQVDWDSHLEGANRLAARLGLSRWREVTPERRALLASRLKREGLDHRDPSSCWKAVEATWDGVTGSVFQDWSSCTLETLLRIPKRGGIDHYLRAKEGGYRNGAPSLTPDEKAEAERIAEIKARRDRSPV